jgi:hypothetical protein
MAHAEHCHLSLFIRVQQINWIAGDDAVDGHREGFPAKGVDDVGRRLLDRHQRPHDTDDEPEDQRHEESDE